MDKNEEFDYDLSLPYDPNGEDVKANEIYSVDIFDIENNKYKIVVKTDMLNFELECNNYDLIELN